MRNQLMGETINMRELSERISQITEDASGTWGISLHDLDTDEKWELNAHELFYSASVIKIPIMITVFASSHRNQFSLSNCLTLKREDLVGGSGVLQHMTPGTQISIYDLIMLMIIQSDNTATNMLIDLVGTEAIQQTMKNIGLEKSNFYHKMMTIDVEREGLNEITAHDMTNMLKKILTGKIISAHACEQMIDILKKQQVRNSLPAKVPEPDEPIIGSLKQWEIANKTGNVSGIRHDVGIFYVGKRTFIASVLTRGLDDLQSPEIIGRVGLEIYQYLTQ
ncbi:serine hydrolase [Paucisalibacillus sp. EB02]|uniref:serine hydrolase n=1 Tax=Paucisalibacillus sp. EB02 TaxID=1347087 RepID=UPI0018CC45F9|nr:serine hydrolase [Paucisalibacillus sp. EB02]